MLTVELFNSERTKLPWASGNHQEILEKFRQKFQTTRATWRTWKENQFPWREKEPYGTRQATRLAIRALRKASGIQSLKILSLIIIQYYSLKDLGEITKQPMQFLKDTLKEIAVYNSKASSKNMWELKPEYRHYDKNWTYCPNFCFKGFFFRMSLSKELNELVLEKLDASAKNLNEKASGQVQRKFQSSGDFIPMI